MRYFPQSREEWFVTRDGMVRKNLVGWDDDKPLPGVRVCLYSWYNLKYDPIAEIAEANWTTYCQRHGYALRMYPGLYRGSDGPIVDGDQDKFAMYYDLRGLFDIVCYLDIDSLFVEMDWKIETAACGPFAWSFDDNGPNSSLLIAGTDDVTERHLRYAYEYAKANDHVRHGKIEPGGMSDQDAMTLLMTRPPFNRTFRTCLPAADLGIAFKEPAPGESPGIRTFAGIPFDEKLAAMKRQVAHA